jgi:hypothetical protein
MCLKFKQEVYMALGKKTGGRQAGTPNKRTAELLERLEALGCDPIAGMAQLALSAENPPELRGRMFAELAGYIYPKRKAVEMRSDDGPSVIFQINTEPPSPAKV